MPLASCLARSAITSKTIRSSLLLFPVPYSLFPTPYSLLPTPCSLFPVPCSLCYNLKNRYNHGIKDTTTAILRCCF
ncbi:MAG: hypothetical protein F6J94_13085 [Moorea sp. SIO1F2]|uniref:hypothetical protein n=1 Tax=Moorena sp. SIO1F2 TaxID=2607819 RepID=UPI0013BD6FC1|nr:hypothetical protein [Moorena sp. SIO1F2]NET82821.1 hypothetical protein [Moorena sp. SIO1F2]